MSEQPPPAPTASAVGPCPTVIQIVGRPGTGSLPRTIAPRKLILCSKNAWLPTHLVHLLAFWRLSKQDLQYDFEHSAIQNGVTSKINSFPMTLVFVCDLWTCENQIEPDSYTMITQRK